MRFSAVLFVLGCLVSMAGAQSCVETGQLQAAPTSARAALEQMSPAERKSSSISVEFGCSDSEAVALGHEVERLRNGGQYDEALAQLGDLEARVGRVAIGNSWHKPVPTIETGLWGRDVRIGNRDSILSLALAQHTSGHLFAVLRRATMPHFSVCMSVDGGATWDETFTWNGSPPTSIDAAVATRHLYVVYNSPGQNAQELRLRRFLCTDGRASAFGNGGAWVAPCTLGVGDSMREVAFATNQDNNQLYLVTLVSDGSVLLSSDDADAMSWIRLPTGITSGARSGLDATDDLRSDTTHLFFSYCDSSDTMRVYDRNGQRFAQLAGTGALTGISAYWDTVICAYEDETSLPHRVRYVGSSDGGNVWTMGTLSDSGVAADAPAVTATYGGFAAVYRQLTPAPEMQFCQRAYSGPGSDPVAIAEHEPYHSRPGIVDLGMGVYGVAYLSDTSPDVRGAYFDRSDWVYGLAEQRRLIVDEGVLRVTPNPLKGRGKLNYALECPAELRVQLYDRTGRVVRTLFAGYRPAGEQSLSFDVPGVAPGVYFIRAVTAGSGLTVRVTVVR